MERVYNREFPEISSTTKYEVGLRDVYGACHEPMPQRMEALIKCLASLDEGDLP